MNDTTPFINEDVGERLTLVVHELRAPLTVIRGYLQMLDRGGTLSAEERIAASAAAQRATERLEQLLDDLVAAVSDPAVFAPAALEPVSLHALANDVASELDPLSTQDVVVTGDEGIVLGDVTRLRQVIENLVSNALKHAPGTGVIEICITDASADSQMVSIQVEDSGPGVPDEYREVVFDLFERVKAGPGTTSGLGLGLPIARAIVRAYGGELTLEDSGEGRGARFVATLPIENG